MVNLVRFKEIFHIWGYTKTEDENRFHEEIMKLHYKNGSFYWEE